MRTHAALFAIVVLSTVPSQASAASCLDDSDCHALDQGGGACGGVVGYCLYPASYACATRTVDLQPEGTPCPDDGDACTADLCDATGQCAHVAIENCQPPPDCAIDADCAYMNESTGCSTTRGSCAGGRCTPVTTPLCSAPAGGSGGGGGCAMTATPAPGAAGSILLLLGILGLSRPRRRCA